VVAEQALVDSPRRDKPLMLVAVESGRIHAIPPGEQRKIRLMYGAVPGSGYESFIELTTDSFIHSPRGLLARYVVPDGDLSRVLIDSEITGLRPVGMPSSEGDLPYAGNYVDPSWVGVNLGAQCDSHCQFCFTDWIRKKPPLTMREVVRFLTFAHRLGVSSVVFSGGEPTLRHDLPSLIQEARAVGYSDICLQTNGNRLAVQGKLTELRTAGLTAILVSLHGENATTHDELTQHPGSHLAVVGALELLSDTDIEVAVNMVVCTHNLAEAAGVLALVRRLNPDAVMRYSYPIVEGSAYAARNVLLPSFPEFSRAVSGAREHVRGERMVKLANVPPCVATASGVDTDYTLSSRRSMLHLAPFFQQESRRGELLAKVSRCHDCAQAANCGGIQVPYLTRFSDAATHVGPLNDTGQPI
jgi:MoaA/NifB/PqqE/SkfB family radical SAM enzyme